MSQAYSIKTQESWIHSTRLHVFMYAMLLVATPFILLRNYLVQAIALASDSSFMIWGVEIKIVPTAVLLAFIVFLAVYRKHITRLRLLAVAIVILLDAMAQQITDYYFDHNFYDLQQNWHYLAYGLYAYIIYRDLNPRNLPLYKIILITYFSALGLSTFDEFFQMYMSSRIFDVCDIGKDVWGVYMGMILVYLSGNQARALLKNWKQIRHRKLKDYYRHPASLLLLLFALSLLFLIIGSVLTEAEYAFLVIMLTIIAFALLFVILHLSQFKTARYVLAGIFIVCIVVQGYFFFKYRNQNIVHSQYGLTIYKGIPIPFFDILIFPNGTFRPVDKKHYFNERDRLFLLKRKPDIILIASGAQGKGGKGFVDPRHAFVYNRISKKATQVIILKNPEACKTYNRLKAENKNVLFIIHNTC